MVSIVYAMICLAAIVLNIILIVKFWYMAEDVKAMREMMERGNVRDGIPSHPAGVPPTMRNDPEPAPMPVKKVMSAQKAISKDDLKKGHKYDLGSLGVCTYEGIYEGEYGFYPVGKIDRNSPYFREDVEPYYLIPESDLSLISV